MIPQTLPVIVTIKDSHLIHMRNIVADALQDNGVVIINMQDILGTINALIEPDKIDEIRGLDFVHSVEEQSDTLR